MQIKFLEIAQIELDEAVAHYNYEAPGLGDDFLSEVLIALAKINNFPAAWHPVSKKTRRCLIRRFPYGIIYQALQNEILVVAMAHLHRDPEYWKERLDQIH